MNSPTRMIARLTLLAAIALCTMGYSKCAFVSDTGGTGGMDNGAGSGTGTFQTTLVLRDSAGVATTDFTFGQAIRFDLEVRNRTGTTVNLVFPDSQIYDFVVLESTSARVRWRWSQNMAFTQVETTLAFAPYSSRSYSVVWDGVQADGTQLPPGDYRARGVLVFDEFASDPIAANETGSALVNFTVR
ncbi:MAG TPA: BsuPI-related putative proteinase inhibitor [Steroidobacteraceae bacterium]|nr:BsuPI-related putative proteinase inhibitor [Steroidobacteraceae bacterium]